MSTAKHLSDTKDRALFREIQRAVNSQLILHNRNIAPWIALKFLLYAVLSVACYAGLFWVRHPLAFVGLYVAYGYCMLLLAFNFAHDFAHGTVFRSEKANHASFVVLFSLLGAHPQSWKWRHIHAHHLAPNVEELDPDLQMTSLIRLSPNVRPRWYHRYQHWYGPVAYTIYSLYWIFVKDFALFFSGAALAGGQRPKMGAYLAFFVQKIVYIGYLLVLPLYFSAQTATTVVFGFLAMHLLQSLFLLFTFLMTHHVEGIHYPQLDNKGAISTTWLMNQVKSSNDMHPFSPLANFLLGGFNNHTAHHLFPQVHHWHYPALSRIMYQVLRRHGIQPNHTSYWGGVVSHIRWLKQMGNPNPSLTEPIHSK